MKKYKFLLFDLDDTLFDFSKSQLDGIKHLFEMHDLVFDDYKYDQYLKINRKYWDMLEHNQASIDIVRSKRFEEFFALHNIHVNGIEIDDIYHHYLNNTCHLLPNALKLLTSLQDKYELYAVTNGFSVTQMARLEECNIKHFFKDVFISDSIGYVKPQIEFFNYVSDKIPNFNKDHSLIIGDSLSSDIQGGLNFNMDCCWFNPNFTKNTSEIQPTYEVNSYSELLEII